MLFNARWSARVQILSAAIVAGGLAIPSAGGAGAQWMLMSREGGCVEVGALKRRIPDLGEVNDPYSFIRLMRERGHQVSSNEIPEAKGKAVAVKVPEKELFLLFVAPEFCEKTRAR